MKTIYTPTKQKRILLVDDDQTVANIYQSKLASERFEVEVAGTGEEALQKLAEGPVDLVILDFSLPGMNGGEVLKTIRLQPDSEALPVIVFTNFYLPGVVESVTQAGATRCLRKSDYTPRQMVQLVRDLFAVGGTTSGASNPDLLLRGSREIIDFETEYQAKLVADFLANGPPRLGRMRLCHHALSDGEHAEIRLAELDEMRRQSRLLAGAAGVAGFREIAQLVNALEALVIRLHSKPASISPSVIRTIGQAIDLLSATFNHAAEPEVELSVSLAILVVDDEIISREAICSAIERAGLQAVSMDDPMTAERLLEKDHFDLIFLDVEMPGQSGLELCAKIRKMATNRTTPVIFVTAHSDFENRAHSVLSGGNDFIAKPFIPVELAVKALIWLWKGKVQASAAADHEKAAQELGVSVSTGKSGSLADTTHADPVPVFSS